MAELPQTKPAAPPADQTVDQGDSPSFPNSVGPAAPADGNPAFGPPAAPDEVGTLGPYRVVKELGRGGMGAVYLAFDERLKRKVALKVMLPRYAAVASSKNRFIREARAAAGITHDHIVTIYEADERDGVPYMAMQFLQGYPLDDYLQRRDGLPLAEVLRIGRETALGLAAAHDIGLAHRDIKPANLWLEAPTGRVKILDFGLAKPTQDEAEDTELTATGVVLGTPAFMAPEQARGERVDYRADLFSLGVVLYRLATGRPPFQGKTMMAMLTAVVADAPPPVRELNPAVPEAFAALIHQLLEKDPARRPASAAAVAEAIRRVENGPAVLHAIPLDALPTQAHVLPGADPFAAIDATEPGEVVHPPAPPPAKSAPVLKWLLAFGVVALALLVVAVTLPQILKVQTPKGTLVIETADPDVEVTVKKGTATLFDKTKQREITLAVGADYTIDLVEAKDGLKLNTKSFEITKNGKTTVKVRVEKPAAAAAAAKAPAPFRVVNGASAADLQEWAAKLPDGYRPTYVCARVGAVPPAYDAVALPVHGDYYLEVPVDGKRIPVPQDVQTRMGAYTATAVMAGDQELWTSVWLRGHGAGSYFWFGDAAFTAFHDREAIRGPGGARPTSLVVLDGTNYTHYWACGLPAPGPAWEAKTGVTLDELVQAVADARGRGWRPELLGVDTVRRPTQFRATFCQNVPEYEWDFSARLGAAEYQRQLDERGAKGFHPRCVCSSQVNGKVEYVVLWLKEPAAFRLSAAARKALQAVLDAGAKLDVEMGGHRVEIPGGATLPDYPMAVLNVDGLGCKGVTDAAVDGWKDLPPVRHWVRLGETGLTDAGLAKLAACPGLAAARGLSLTALGITDAGLAAVAKFPNLEDLELCGTPVTGTGIAALTGLKSLRFLNLDDCGKLTDAGAAAVGRLPALKRLFLFRTNLTDAGIDALAPLSTLEEVSIFGPGVTDKCVPAIKKLTGLTRLVVGGGCGITDDGLKELKALPALADFRVHEGSKFTAKGLAALKDFPALTEVHLSHNGDTVTDAVLLGLKGNTKVTHLNVFNSKVTAAGLKKLAALIPQCQIAWDGDTIEPTAAAPSPPAGAVVEVHGVTPAALVEWVAKLPPGYAPTWAATRTGGAAALFDAVAVANPAAAGTRAANWSEEDHAAYDGLKKTHRLIAEAPYLVDGKYHTIDVGVADGRPFETWYGKLDFVHGKIEEGGKATRVQNGVPERWLPQALSAVRQVDGTFTYSVIITWQPDRAFEWRAALSPKELAAAVDEYRTKGWRPHVVNAIYNTAEPTYLAAFTENPAKEAWDFTPNLPAAEYERQFAARAAKGGRPRCVCSHVAGGTVTYTVVWDAGPPAANAAAPGRTVDREAAAWAVARKGAVEIDGAWAKPGDPLPAGPFRLTGVRLQDAGHATTDDDLARLAACPDLTSLTVWHAAVTDKGLKALADTPQAAAGRLSNLVVESTAGITDAGMKEVARMPGLKYAGFKHAGVTDAGLPALTGLTELRLLQLDRTKVTADGVKKLSAALPKCKITCDAGTFGPTEKP